MNYIFRLILFSMIFSISNFFAQEDSSDVNFSVGTDLVSRYVWRGGDINNAPCIQPSIYFNMGGFSIGFWGSYALAKDFRNDPAYDSEVDPSISYTLQTGTTGSFTATITDYYYPEAGLELGNFNNYNEEDSSGGAHTFEAGLLYSGPESFPVSLYVGVNFYNDAGKNLYFEAGYPFTLNDVDLSIFFGATPGSNKNYEYYGTDKFSLINAGITATKSIKITEYFKLPIFVSYVLNPEAEKSFLIFGITL